MTDTTGIPTGPINCEPLDYPSPGVYPSTLAKAAILRDAFSAAGVELGAYDKRIAHWLADTADWSTFAVITSWVQRAGRAAIEHRDYWHAEAMSATTRIAELEHERRTPDA